MTKAATAGRVVMTFTAEPNAKGSGARPGKRNALRHGRYTREHRTEMRKVRAFLKMSNEQILAFAGTR